MMTYTGSKCWLLCEWIHFHGNWIVSIWMYAKPIWGWRIHVHININVLCYSCEYVIKTNHFVTVFFLCFILVSIESSLVHRNFSRWLTGSPQSATERIALKKKEEFLADEKMNNSEWASKSGIQDARAKRHTARATYYRYNFQFRKCATAVASTGVDVNTQWQHTQPDTTYEINNIKGIPIGSYNLNVLYNSKCLDLQKWSTPANTSTQVPRFLLRTKWAFTHNTQLSLDSAMILFWAFPSFFCRPIVINKKN